MWEKVVRLQAPADCCICCSGADKDEQVVRYTVKAGYRALTSVIAHLHCWKLAAPLREAPEPDFGHRGGGQAAHARPAPAKSRRSP
jgi:hypothetical protein